MACVLAPTWEVLLGLRLLQGVTLAGLLSAATPPTSARSRTLAPTPGAAGVYIGGTAIGGMTGRLVTGPIVEVADWRWALAAIAAVGVGCTVAVRVLPCPRATSSPHRPASAIWRHDATGRR